MKITDYITNNNPDPELDYAVVAYNGLDYEVKLGNLNFGSPRNKIIPRIAEVLSNNEKKIDVFPAGSSSFSTANNHPGYIFTGIAMYIWYGNTNSYIFIGGEVFEAVFNESTLIASDVGMVDLPIGPTNGIYIHLTAGGVVTGRNTKASATSISSSSYTISAGTWYRAKVTLNSTKTQSNFYLYDSNGILLWSDSLFANIPISSARLGLSQLSVNYQLDWVAFYNTTDLTR